VIPPFLMWKKSHASRATAKHLSRDLCHSVSTGTERFVFRWPKCVAESSTSNFENFLG